MKGIGLVLSGGGGKGAYEIGVWKYLHENGLDNCVRAVSGTSVGALNAALFVGSSFDKALNMWRNISTNKILSPRKIEPQDIIKWLAQGGLISTAAMANPVAKAATDIAVKAISGAASAGLSTANLFTTSILSTVRSDHFFSRSGLSEMIDESIDFAQLQNSNIPCFVTCLQHIGLRKRRFTLNQYDSDMIKSLLLASSAIPVIFPSETIDGVRYCDGGVPLFGDNTPVQPVYDMGVEYIIVVHLNQDSVIDKSLFPDSKIIEVIPSEDLGDLLNGTLDFSSEGAEKRMDLGYKDAQKVLETMLQNIHLIHREQSALKKIANDNEDFHRANYELELKKAQAEKNISLLQNRLNRRKK